MDLTSVLICTFLITALALGALTAMVSELHCYNQIIKSFKDVAFEPVPDHTPYFSTCKPEALFPGMQRCVHKKNEFLIIVTENNTENHE